MPFGCDPGAGVNMTGSLVPTESYYLYGIITVAPKLLSTWTWVHVSLTPRQTFMGYELIITGVKNPFKERQDGSVGKRRLPQA